MPSEELIAVQLFCTHQGVEVEFVHALHERGLITVTIVEQIDFVPASALSRIEQLARMHYELEIDLPGIEAISHLLERMELAQEELRVLRERLLLYERTGG